MIRLTVFDLDGTLAPIGAPVPPKAAELLLRLEEKGMKIALCSGKPVYYLSGLARQIGLKTPYLLGENGAVLQVGNHLPPALRRPLAVPQSTLLALQELRRRLNERLPALWYQPNEVCLTPFPVGREEFDTVEAVLKESEALLTGITVYRHSDSFDLCPKEVSKENGVRMLCRELGLPLSQVAAVGDGDNDRSMLQIAALSLGIAPMPEEAVDLRFESILPALEHLLKEVEKTP